MEIDPAERTRRQFWVFLVPLVGVAVAAALALVVKLVPASIPVPDWLPLKGADDYFHPKPRTQLSYLLAISIPAALFWLGRIVLGRRPPGTVPPLWLVQAIQLVLVGFAATMVVAQRSIYSYFGVGEALAAAMVVALLLNAPWVKLGQRLGNRRVRQVALAIGCGGMALGLVRAFYPNAYDLSYTLDEFASTLNGRTSLVDFFPQYQNLLSLLLEPLFWITGLTERTFTLAMVGLEVLGFWFLYDTFRRLTRSEVGAVSLLLPLAFAAFHPLPDDPEHQVNYIFNLYGTAPIRYFGPWLVFWLLGRWLEEPATGRGRLLYFAGVLSAINNLDFGIPALVGAATAQLLSAGDPLAGREAWKRLARELLPGAGAGAGLYLCAILLRSGHLPDLRSMFMFQQTFARYGLGALPTPDFGLHWLLWLTFMAAIAKGLFLEGEGESGRLRRGLLLHSGVFGAGALAYYIYRSHWQTLVAVFPAWGMAMVLLARVTWEEWEAGRSSGRIWWEPFRKAPATLLVAMAFGLAIVEAEHLRLPWQMPDRLSDRAPMGWTDRGSKEQLVLRLCKPGEPVMITWPFGHLVAAEAGVDDLFPLTQKGTLITEPQLALVFRQLDRGNVRRVFGQMPAEMSEGLQQRGFHPLGSPVPVLWERDTPQPSSSLAPR